MAEGEEEVSLHVCESDLALCKQLSYAIVDFVYILSYISREQMFLIYTGVRHITSACLFSHMCMYPSLGNCSL